VIKPDASHAIKVVHYRHSQNSPWHSFTCAQDLWDALNPDLGYNELELFFEYVSEEQLLAIRGLGSEVQKNTKGNHGDRRAKA